MAALASISSVPASYTPHDIEIARKLRENPKFDSIAKRSSDGAVGISPVIARGWVLVGGNQRVSRRGLCIADKIARPQRRIQG
jgi:hypothetical protein